MVSSVASGAKRALTLFLFSGIFALGLCCRFWEKVSIRPCAESHETSNIPSSTASISTSTSRSGLGWAMSSWSLADRRSFRAASMGPKTFFLSLRLLALIWLDLALLAMVAVLQENSLVGECAGMTRARHLLE